MLFGRRRPDDDALPRSDRGLGSLDEYTFDLRPRADGTTIRLAASDPHQDLLAAALDAEKVESAIMRRTADEERTDAPMPVRLFVDGRVVGPVGQVPRGLEPAVTEALARLETAGRKPRIPVEVVQVRGRLRVDLLIGRTR